MSLSAQTSSTPSSLRNHTLSIPPPPPLDLKTFSLLDLDSTAEKEHIERERPTISKPRMRIKVFLVDEANRQCEAPSGGRWRLTEMATAVKKHSTHSLTSFPGRDGASHLPCSSTRHQSFRASIALRPLFGPVIHI